MKKKKKTYITDERTPKFFDTKTICVSCKIADKI